MARRPKLTQEMVDEAIALKADGLSNGDIIAALGIHESTFYRWIGDPKTKLQRALSEGLKKEESAFKRDAAHDHPLGGACEKPVLDGRRVAARAQVPRRVRQGRSARATTPRRTRRPGSCSGVVAQPVQERLPGLDGDGADG